MTARGLVAADIEVRFGGLVAVDGVSVDAPVGRITGLIGPNGAGKTTTFNVCSGLVRPARGSVLLDGVDISSLTPARRARQGLGRTFQRMELFDGLTVAENVAMGREAALAGSSVAGHLLRRARDRHAIDTAVAEAIELCSLGDLAGSRAGVLSTGQRRLVELARALAGDFHVLLLDEPSSGLDHLETAGFGQILQAAVATRELAVLLVEHDMELVMGVCDHIVVIDFGRPLFEGSPAEVRASPIVRAAYLGEAA